MENPRFILVYSLFNVFMVGPLYRLLKENKRPIRLSLDRTCAAQRTIGSVKTTSAYKMKGIEMAII